MERKNDRLPIFTERFRELQGERTNTEFADFLGISRQTVGFYSNGNRVPDAITLIKICQKCDVTADWLLGVPGSVKSLNSDIAAVGKYTGLSESAINFLHSIREKEVPSKIISAIIAHGGFPSMIGFIMELYDAKRESEFHRMEILDGPEKTIDGGHIIRGVEREIFAEYMIETCIDGIVDDITCAMIDKEYPIE